MKGLIFSPVVLIQSAAVLLCSIASHTFAGLVAFTNSGFENTLLTLPGVESFLISGWTRFGGETIVAPPTLIFFWLAPVGSKIFLHCGAGEGVEQSLGIGLHYGTTEIKTEVSSRLDPSLTPDTVRLFAGRKRSSAVPGL